MYEFTRKSPREGIRIRQCSRIHTVVAVCEIHYGLPDMNARRKASQYSMSVRQVFFHDPVHLFIFNSTSTVLTPIIRIAF